MQEPSSKVNHFSSSVLVVMISNSIIILLSILINEIDKFKFGIFSCIVPNQFSLIWFITEFVKLRFYTFQSCHERKREAHINQL